MRTGRQAKRVFSRSVWRAILSTCLCCFLLTSCGDPISRHKVLSTIFDGVPSLPPAGEVCNEYCQQEVPVDVAGIDSEAVESKATQNTHSSHQPYKEKKCGDCHSNDKNVNAGLIVPKRELCGVCHQNFIKGHNVHGPVAVGDCLACHLPHNSQYPSLLKEDPDKVCAICHQEARLAAEMHERFVVKAIGCGECHDPHAGDARYFLK